MQFELNITYGLLVRMSSSFYGFQLPISYVFYLERINLWKILIILFKANLNNVCGNDPCNSNGICTVVGTGYNCDCFDDFGGLNCNILLNTSCASDPCMNNGVCTVNSSTGGFTCTCLANYTGTFCENDTSNPCASNPCNNGNIRFYNIWTNF